VVRRDKDSTWVEGRNSPFQGPSGTGRWVTGCTWDAVRRTWKEVAGSDVQRGTKEMAGAGWGPEKGRNGQWPSQGW
jgi:hypothetical protein